MAKIFSFGTGKEILPQDSTINNSSEEEYDLPAKNNRDDFFINNLKKMHKITATVLNEKHFVTLRLLKQKMSGLQGKISDAAYKEYLRMFQNKTVAELVPILDNLTDHDFKSRPAYARAFIDTLEARDLEEATTKSEK